jgi:ABC-type multidrug transport system ATPase subunit
VLDEPWEGLDAQTREEVPSIVAEVAASGGRVLVSDHRGETGRLPGARIWQVAGGSVRAAPPVAADARCLIEVAVMAEQAPATVAQLRAAGHDIVRVRPW